MHPCTLQDTLRGKLGNKSVGSALACFTVVMLIPTAIFIALGTRATLDANSFETSFVETYCEVFSNEMVSCKYSCSSLSGTAKTGGRTTSGICIGKKREIGARAPALCGNGTLTARSQDEINENGDFRVCSKGGEKAKLGPEPASGERAK